MNITRDQQTQISFINGVAINGTVAPISGRTWDGGNPATYNTSTVVDGLGKWGSSKAGTGANITYHFDLKSNWSIDEKAAWKAAMALWSNVADINFDPATNQSTTDFSIIRGNDGAYASVTSSISVVGSDILPVATRGSGIISVDTSNPSFGPITTDYSNPDYNYPFGTIVHELGHVIGLDHAGPYNGDVNETTQQFSKYDMYIWSTMSYISPETRATKYFKEYPVKGTDYNDFKSPQTPMILDIAAIQQLYGAPIKGPLNESGKVFGFNSNITGDAAALYNFETNKTPIISIWSGGKNNTLDLSGYDTDNLISLEPGTFSSVAGMTNNVSVAFNSIIETGIGGSGDDQIFGSVIDNYLKGNAGDDHIDGSSGINYAIYNGPASKYDVTISAADEFFEIFDKSGLDGNDFAINIQNLKFADSTLASSDFTSVRSISETDLEKLVSIYVEIAQRAPDSLGLIYWGARIADGATLFDVANAIFNSPAGQANYSPTLTTQHFIDTVYQNSFNRPADQGGMEFWSGLIDSGQISRSDLFVYLTDVPENSIEGKTLTNKMNAAGYFSSIQGLNDLKWAEDAIAGIDSGNDTLYAAYNRIDQYADIASADITSQLTVKLLGIAPFMPYPS